MDDDDHMLQFPCSCCERRMIITPDGYKGALEISLSLNSSKVSSTTEKPSTPSETDSIIQPPSLHQPPLNEEMLLRKVIEKSRKTRQALEQAHGIKERFTNPPQSIVIVRKRHRRG